jgi:hypothetical protein
MNLREAVIQAITDDHQQIDVGRLALFAVMWIVLGAIPWVLILASVALVTGRSLADLWGVGAAIGAICTGFAGAIAALGAYVSQDKKPTAPLPPTAPSASLLK